MLYQRYVSFLLFLNRKKPSAQRFFVVKKAICVSINTYARDKTSDIAYNDIRAIFM